MKSILFCIFILLNSFIAITAQNNYVSSKPEKVFLHTDRNIYVAGDNLYYTLYLQGNPGQMSRYAYLVIRDTRNSHVTDLRLEISNQLAYGSILLSDTLGSGIYQIICYTNCMRNDTEESYFTKEILITNRFDETFDRIKVSESFEQSGNSAGINSSSAENNEILTIIPDKKVFSPREKISFSLGNESLTDNSIVHLSVSVSEIIPGIPVGKNISEYMSENNSPHVNSNLNQSACKYYSEINGAVLQGQILFAPESSLKIDSSAFLTGQSQKNYLLVSSPDSLVNMQFTKIDSTGSFSILLNPFYDGKELFIRLKESVKATLIPDNKFTLTSNFIPSDSFNLSIIKEALLRNGKIAQVRKIYNEQAIIKTEKVFLPSASVPRLYYSNFRTIYPSDYLKLNDFTEISKEIIPALKIKKTRNNYLAGFPVLQYLVQDSSEPAIFLDGVPVNNINQVITMGTDQIKRIEILPEIRYYGDIRFSGIVAIFSSNMKINSTLFTPGVLKIEALLSEPYTRPQEFIPKNDGKHYPDMRQVLLWDPDIVMNSNSKQQIDFYASDIEGNFRIDIQGITTNGNTVQGSAVITIQSKKK